MRASRRAAMVQLGVKWLKYNCTRSDYGYQYYSPGSFGYVSRYGDADTPQGGSSSYSFNSATGQYSNAGASVSYPNALSGGTVYSAVGSGCYMISSTGDGWNMYYAQAQGPYYSSYTTYTVGEETGSVYADEGAYPDAKNGYVYTTKITQDGKEFIVMRNGNTYYAYIMG